MTSSVVRALLVVLGLSVLAPLTSGHICMWQPRQRGAMNLDNPGDNSCVHKGPDPCGNVSAGEPVAFYTAGGVATVEFQQNLNHFFGPNPGSLVVQVSTVANPTEADFSYLFGEIEDFNAMDEVNWANFTLTNVMPTTPCNPCVLRLTYNSRNPGENTSSTSFYQCSDIVIEPAKDFDPMQVLEQERDQRQQKMEFARKQLAKAARASRGADSEDAHLAGSASPCTAPAQFETAFLSSSAYMPHAGVGSLSYDAKNQLIVSRQQNQVTLGIEQHFINFSSGIEWRYNGPSQSCGEYGLDEWNDWSYGPSQNEVFSGTITLGSGEVVNTWEESSANYTFGSDAAACTPVLKLARADVETTLYYDTTLGIADPSTFIPPAACHSTKSYQMIHHQGASIEQIRAYARTLKQAPTKSSAARKHSGATYQHHAYPRAAIAKPTKIQQRLIEAREAVRALQKQRKHHSHMHMEPVVVAATKPSSAKKSPTPAVVDSLVGCSDRSVFDRRFTLSAQDCPAGEPSCQWLPGKFECCLPGENCIPNSGCRC